MPHTLGLLLLLAQVHGEPVSLPLEDTEEPHYGVDLRLSGLALWTGMDAGLAEGYVQVEPTFILDGGEPLRLSLGAPLRLRLPSGPAGAHGSLVRMKDWDSLSDFGQLVRSLSLGTPASAVTLRAGALEDYSLLSGHLVNRYSNRSAPDAHPAGAFLTGSLGPLHAEVFASDVLAPRLLGGEVALDVAYLLGQAPEPTWRHALALSAVHDFGRATEAPSPPALAHADLDIGLVFHDDWQLFALAGVGTSVGGPGQGMPWGAVAGLGLETLSDIWQVHARLEARTQRGGFRQGFFGPDYEVARFLARPVFPDGASAFAELSLAHDSIHLDHARRELHLLLALEAFSWGRTDAQVRVAAWLDVRRLHVSLSALAVGVGQADARYTFSGELHYRFSQHLYVLAQGGTLLFPSTDFHVRPGAFVSLGLGADYAR